SPSFANCSLSEAARRLGKGAAAGSSMTLQKSYSARDACRRGQGRRSAVRYIAVLNRDGGTLRTMDLEVFCAEAREIFERYEHVLDCQVVAGGSVEIALRRAAADKGADAVIAGGGDGTISSAAAIAFETGKPL